jgi:hypothetical protein
VKTATTTGNGEYIFRDIPFGDYNVCVVPMPGFAQVPAPQLDASCPNGAGRHTPISDLVGVAWEGVNFGYNDVRGM